MTQSAALRQDGVPKCNLGTRVNNLPEAGAGLKPQAPPPSRGAALWGLILAYGAGTMVSQVLILRELMVVAQGQELKLALALWCWLLWAGVGSLGGGRLAARWAVSPAYLAGVLSLLALLLPATILTARALPSLASLPWGQSLPPGTALLLFLGLLAPFGLVSGYFFPCACQALTALSPSGSIGRAYYLETLGAGLGLCLLQLLLLGRYPGLALGLGTGLLLALGAWVLARPAGLRARLGAALVVLALAGACFSLAPLESLSRSWQWPGRQVVAVVDSPYALLTATREAEQFSFFANNVWHFTHPDPLTAEHQVHLALLAHPQPQRVLLLGGGVAGLVPEILKTASVTRLDYVELDPQLVRLVQDLLPAAAGLARDPRVQVHYQDARRFLEETAGGYDVILLALPEPQNAQLNRFYSREFFRLARRHLKPQGVFSFSLTGAETSLHPLRAAYLSLAYHTLSQVFPEVLAWPGERVRFVAAAGPGTLVTDPVLLLRRLAARRLDLQYVREYYLLHDLSRPRLEYLGQVLSRQPLEVNTDLNPRCYFYDLVLSGLSEGPTLREMLLGLGALPPLIPWVAVGLGTMVLGLLVRRRPGPLYLYQVLVMGLGAMALEIIVLILYQIHLGYLYRQLGLLIAAFLGGMAGGGALGTHLAERPPATLRLMGAAFQGGLAALAALLALFLPWAAALPLLTWETTTQAGFVLVLALAGFGGGGVFATSAALWAQARPDPSARGGVLYALDLLGATLGTLGVSLVVLPVWGLLPALYLLAVLHAGASLMLLGGKDG